MGSLNEELDAEWPRIVGPDLPPMRLRERRKRQDSAPASASISAAAANRSESSITLACWAWVVGASGLAKIERTIVATYGPADFGTRVSRFRRKWVLQTPTVNLPGNRAVDGS
jgi:hypothetical protein